MAHTEERPGLLRQRQARELLAVSQTTLTKLRRSGDVETVHLPSGGVRISEVSVQRIIEGQASEHA